MTEVHYAIVMKGSATLWLVYEHYPQETFVPYSRKLTLAVSVGGFRDSIKYS